MLRPVRNADLRRTGHLSVWLLLALPVFLLLLFFSLNVRFYNHVRATQLTVTDASALAAAQALVDDRMLAGDAQNLDELMDMARLAAQQYADYNPLGPQQLQYSADDITFTFLDNPYDPSLQLIETVTVRGRRVAEDNNAVPIFGQGLFCFCSVNVITESKALLDRQVAGLRPIFGNNLPLAPIAFQVADWTAQVEAVYTNPPSSYTVILGGPNAAFLEIGAEDEAGLIDQLLNGIAPADLAGFQFGGQFVLDTNNELSVPILEDVTPGNLKAAFEELRDTQKQLAWPLFSLTDGTHVIVVRFMAARVLAVLDGADENELIVTLQPTFLADPSVVTEPTRDLNLYLSRVRLTN